MIHDQRTVAYFDTFTPRFNEQQYHFATDYLRAHAQPGDRILDIGCGDGSVLRFFKGIVPSLALTGLDVSTKYLGIAAERADCETIHGSILDTSLAAELHGGYRFVVLGSVLHHLIGQSRAQSREYALMALCNAALMTSPGGAIILFENTWQPKVAMDAVFYIKKIASQLSPRRLELGSTWLNIGEPVVSYYTTPELGWMIEQIPRLRIAEHVWVSARKVGYVLREVRVGFVLEKPPE